MSATFAPCPRKPAFGSNSDINHTFYRMTETPQPEVAPATRETDNPRVLFAVQMVLLTATVALCLLTAGAPFTNGSWPRSDF